MASSLPPPPPPPPTDRPAGSLSGRPAPRYPPSEWGLGDAFVATGVFFLVSLVVGGVAYAASDNSFLDPEWLPWALAVPAVAQAGYIVWAARTKGRGVGADFGFGFHLSDLAVGAGLFVAGLFLVYFVTIGMEVLFDASPSATVADQIDESDEDGGGISGWIYLTAFLGATVIPVIEELVYRGLWWSALEKRGMREEWVLVVTSAVFAAVHLEPVRFPILFVLGLALGYGRIRTGRIGPCIAAHAYINTLGMVVLLQTLD